jgi:hypothetical protein
MLEIELSSDTSIFKFYIFLKFVLTQNFLCHLELESLKNGLIVEKARKFDISHQFFHIDQRQSHKFKHFFQKFLFFSLFLRA